jgi:hypothetical protein
MRNIEFAFRLVGEAVDDMKDRGFKVSPKSAREATMYVFGAAEAAGSANKIIDSDAKSRLVIKRVEEILMKGRVKKNPVRPRRGESERDFVSRCMSEEKKKFPKQKQRIAVCLSKARRNPYLQSGVYIPEDGDINRQAAKMG